MKRTIGGWVLALVCCLAVSAQAELTLLGVGAIGAGIAVGLEGLGQAFRQIDATGRWYTSSNLSAAQKQQMQESIDYLRSQGFTKEADQAQKLLDGGYFVFRDTKTAEFAETMGGLSQGIRGAGYIAFYNQFFSPSSDEGLPFSSDPAVAAEQQKRMRAKVLIHELEHLNTQVNRIRSALLDCGRDLELGPMKRTAGAARQLGYTDDEIRQIADKYARGPYRRYARYYRNLLLPGGSGGGASSGGAKDGAVLPNFQ